jgi:hypothetical protein
MVKSAEEWLNSNLDHRRQRGWQGDSPAAPTPSVLRPSPKSAGVKPEPDAAPATPSLADARRDREETKAERERLALEREKGELVPRAVVRRFLEARGRMDRDMHLAWVSGISAVFGSELGINPTRLHARLEAEMRQHLQVVSKTPVPEAQDIA